LVTGFTAGLITKFTVILEKQWWVQIKAISTD